MKAMDNHSSSSGDAWGFIGGALSSITFYLISIDWTAFLEELATGTLKVAVFGAVGGVAGLFGKKIAERIFFKKKNKKHDRVSEKNNEE